MDHAKWPPYQSPGFHCPQPSELIFLPSNLFAKTDPGCPATTAMFQQKYVPQKNVIITTTRHWPHPSGPALCAQHRSMDDPQKSPYQFPGFHCPQPSELIFFALKSFCQNRSRMSCYHGNVSAKICAAKKCHHNHHTTLASSLEPRPLRPAPLYGPCKMAPYQSPGFHCPQPSELIFLPSNLFAKTDPGCPATTAMFQQKYVPQKNVSIIIARHSPHPSSPALCAQHRSMDDPQKSPYQFPGFHCPQPSELIFLPSNLFAKTDPGCPATTAMFQQKYVPQKNVSIIIARHSPHPSSPALCAQHRSMVHAKWPPYQSLRVSLSATQRTHFFLPSNLFAKTDPGCPATTAMFQQKYVPQKNVSIIIARHSPHPSSPALCAQHRSMDHAKWPPYQSPGFHCHNPANSFFCPQIFLPNRSRMSCHHGNVSAKICAAKK